MLVLIPGHVAVTGRTWSLSLRRVCIAMPIWRRLLMSFVAFARCDMPKYAGYRKAIIMAMTARTTAISMRVKARAKQEFLVIGLVG